MHELVGKNATRIKFRKYQNANNNTYEQTAILLWINIITTTIKDV